MRWLEMFFIQFFDGNSGIDKAFRQVLRAFVFRRRVRINQAINALSSYEHTQVKVVLTCYIRIASQFLSFFDIGCVASGSGYDGDTLHFAPAVPAKARVFAKLSDQCDRPAMAGIEPL